MHARIIKRLLVVRDVLVGMLERPLQTLQLQRAKLILAGMLDGVQPRLAHGVGHGYLSPEILSTPVGATSGA
ncbi:hypothetical protein G6F63_016905 [Rhizopus arrhizus]|uniref:Uncharacterized protein n=1 Tax=Rhizopus delemar TaxID=936053 RepID=A0A9P6XQD4_9FUNG|nr:hypothetical protein G6F63_016905 [Rhizopus arrhizus]KAG1374317.1 hypothetical protein G6F59_018416 [Rhizopus arrhizus]KAG1530434.1 hypothetical protein G6F50_017322 [Rhizopus delemar]